MTDLDMDILHRAVAGDHRALAELLVWLRPVVGRYCARRIPRWGDVAVDDVVQESLVSIVGSLPKFEPRAVEHFLGWVWVIVRCRVYDAYRGQPPETPVADLDDVATHVVATHVSPERLHEGREELAELAKVLGRLKPTQRAVVRLRAEGLSVSESAAALGMTTASVRVTHHRAMTVLRAWRRATEGEVGAP
ncbi:RNA polymerase sigma factor [Actinophytocola sediminis]